jgi:hypothetical protein
VVRDKQDMGAADLTVFIPADGGAMLSVVRIQIRGGRGDLQSGHSWWEVGDARDKKTKMVARMTDGAQTVLDFCHETLGVPRENVDIAHVLATTTERNRRDEWEQLMARGIGGAVAPETVSLDDAGLQRALRGPVRFGAAILDRERMAPLWPAVVRSLAARCIAPQYFATTDEAVRAVRSLYPDLQGPRERRGRAEDEDEDGAAAAAAPAAAGGRRQQQQRRT